jgi:hypothetical protein
VRRGVCVDRGGARRALERARERERERKKKRKKIAVSTKLLAWSLPGPHSNVGSTFLSHAVIRPTRHSALHELKRERQVRVEAIWNGGLGHAMYQPMNPCSRISSPDMEVGKQIN